MNDYRTWLVIFVIILWFSTISLEIKHNINLTRMLSDYKKQNERLIEENKDMQERINALLNITVEEY